MQSNSPTTVWFLFISSWLGHFLRLSLLVIINWDLSSIFHMIGWSCVFWRGRPQRLNAILTPTPHINGTYCQHYRSLHVYLGHYLGEVVFVSFHYLKVILCLCFPTATEVARHRPHLKNYVLHFISLKVNYQKNWFETLPWRIVTSL